MEAKEYKFTLPYPPSVNTAYATVRGRRVLSKNGRDYKMQVGICVLEQGRRKTIANELALVVEVYPPDLRRRDIDNVCKILLDSLTTAQIYADDSQIADLHLIRRKITKPGRVEVTIRELA